MELSEDERKISDKLSLKLSAHPNILHGSSDHKTESFAAHLSQLCDNENVFLDDGRFDIERFQNNSEKIGNYLKSMIKTVFDLHGHGISVVNLDDSNIVIHDGTVKFSGLLYTNASYDSKKKDIQSLGRAMKNLTQNNQSLYLDDLVSLMNDYRDSERLLLLNHLALKSCFERLGFTEQSSKISLLRGDTNLLDRYFAAVDAIIRSENNSKDWTQRIRGLEGPVKDCFEYEQRPSTGYRNTNLDMLRFGRNMVGHLREHLRKAKYKGKYKGIVEEVDYFIMRHFGAELLSFQKLAHEKGILEYLMPGYTSSSAVSLSSVVPSPAVPPSSSGPSSNAPKTSAGPSSAVSSPAVLPSSAGLSSSGPSSAAPKTSAVPSSAARQVSYKSKLLGCN